MRHVMVVGGTFRDWADLTDPQWSDRVDELGAVAASANVAWLTLRPYEPGQSLVTTASPWPRGTARWAAAA